MVKAALWVELKAKAGKEKELEEFQIYLSVDDVKLWMRGWITL